MGKQINCVTVIHWNTIQRSRETVYTCNKWISKWLCWVKRTGLKKLQSRNLSNQVAWGLGRDRLRREEGGGSQQILESIHVKIQTRIHFKISMLYVIFLNYKTTKSLSKTIWLYLLKSNPVHRLPALLRGCTRPTRALKSKTGIQGCALRPDSCQPWNNLKGHQY